MKILTYITAMFLILGLLVAPGAAFAQESSSTGSDSTLQSSNSMVLDSMVPLLKGSSGGGRSSSSSSKSSSSKKVKVGDGDDDDDTDSSSSGGFSWITVIIILVVFLGLIGVLVWFFFLRK